MREKVGHGYSGTRGLAPGTALSSRFLPAWWGHAAVLPLVALLSVLPLIWFGRNWRVSADGSLYLLEARYLLSGSGYTAFGGVPQTVRGPVFPAILSLLLLIFGRDLDSLAWAVRLLVLVNPVLLYLLVRRLAGTGAGLLAAALMSVFG
ncbi:MAG: glycosyltransferase family 39 protein, partial [Chloroflexota bacterium]|nr:glycosyltransferase family 39 protein [Chloroflexota bacterium]